MTKFMKYLSKTNSLYDVRYRQPKSQSVTLPKGYAVLMGLARSDRASTEAPTCSVEFRLCAEAKAVNPKLMRMKKNVRVINRRLI